MKYQIGDRILILHSGEEGRIVDFINKDMVMVEVSGVTFPAFLDQIDFPYFKEFSAKKNSESLKKARKSVEELKPERNPKREKVEPGAWISFMPVYDKDLPDEDIVDHFRISVINHTDDRLQFDYRYTRSGQLELELRNELQPMSDLYLHDVALEDMNDSPRFHFAFRLTAPGKGRADTNEVEFRIRGKQLFRHMEELREKNQAHFSCLLFDSWPARGKDPQPDLGRLSNAGFRPHRTNERKERLQSVVDLHIDRIVEDPRGMSAHEILQTQLKTLERHLDLMVAARQPKLTVIHGLGTGRLREEVHEILRHRREVSSFQNVHHPLFGYGATEIFFSYI